MGFPVIDLGRMNLFIGRNLIDRLVLFENLKHGFGFEIGGMTFSHDSILYLILTQFRVRIIGSTIWALTFQSIVLKTWHVLINIATGRRQIQLSTKAGRSI